MAVLSDFIPTSQQFQIFWPCPIRAHVGVNINFRFSWYEVNNEQLTWSLSNAPSWMAINSFTGRVSGTPLSSGTHSSITVTAQRGSGLTVSKTFTCTVDNSKFIFVATTGNDSSGDGTIGNPYLTIAKGISMLQGLAGTGKTVYVRGGEYVEGYGNPGGGEATPFHLKDRIETDYNEVRSYPGESAYWNYGGVLGLSGFNFNAKYNIISNMEIGNGNRLSFPKLISMSAAMAMIKDCVIHDSDGTAGNNLGGIEVKPQSLAPSNESIIVDRCVFYNCYQKSLAITHSSQDNGCGVTLFTDSGTVGNPNFYIWILNCKAYSNGYGFKVKHTANDRCIVQNCESIANGRGNFHLGSPNMSVRHCVSMNTLAGKAWVCNSDNGAAGPAWYERNTLVEAATATTAYLVNVQGNTQGNGGTFFHNIYAAVTGTSRVLFRMWDSEPDWSIYDVNINRNLYYNVPVAGGFMIYNTSSGQTVNFTVWKSKTCAGGTKSMDPNSLMTNPLFVNAATGNLNITSSSPAATLHADGTYVGALEPGKTYGVFGQLNTNLVDFNINGASSSEPPPEPPSETGYFGASRRRGYGL